MPTELTPSEAILAFEAYVFVIMTKESLYGPIIYLKLYANTITNTSTAPLV